MVWQHGKNHVTGTKEMSFGNSSESAEQGKGTVFPHWLVTQASHVAMEVKPRTSAWWSGPRGYQGGCTEA